jgi:hypothetical protein
MQAYMHAQCDSWCPVLVHSQELSALCPTHRVKTGRCGRWADLGHVLSWVAIGRHSILCLVVDQARDAIQSRF